MITPKNILSHELIGLDVYIRSSTCNTQDLYGKVVYETKQSLLLETDNGTKQIIKNTVTKFMIRAGTDACFINGESLIGRPEDRITRSS